MAGPSFEQNACVSGVNGKNNIIKCENSNINVIGTMVINDENQRTHSSRDRDKPIRFMMKDTTELSTGRDDELSTLHEKTKLSSVTVITGLGGIGKTELLRMYVKKYGKNYENNIIWIDAVSHESIMESFQKLAKEKLDINTKCIDGTEKCIETIVDEVYEYFENKKCLFILDDALERKAIEEDVRINKFLTHELPPNAKKPYMLITSPNREWSYLELFDLKPFTETDAKLFMIEALELNSFQSDKKNVSLYGEICSIEKLSEDLGYFPLALRLAAAYIREENKELKGSGNFFSIDSYRHDFGTKSEVTKKLFESKLPDDSGDYYKKTIFTIWNITLERIKSKMSNNALTELLNAIANSDSANLKEMSYNKIGDKKSKGMRYLEQYCLIDREENGIIKVNRLVKEVIRLEITWIRSTYGCHVHGCQKISSLICRKCKMCQGCRENDICKSCKFCQECLKRVLCQNCNLCQCCKIGCYYCKNKQACRICYGRECRNCLGSCQIS